MKFWKKDDDPFASDSLTQDFSQEFSTPPAQTPPPQNSLGNSQEPFGQFTPDNHPPGMTFAPADAAPAAKGQENNWQYDVIIARLDSIKSQLDVVTHRIERLEQQQTPKKESGRGPWYTK